MKKPTIQDLAKVIYSNMTDEEKAVQAFGMTDINVLTLFKIEWLKITNEPTNNETEQSFVLALFDEARKSNNLIA